MDLGFSKPKLSQIKMKKKNINIRLSAGSDICFINKIHSSYLLVSVSIFILRPGGWCLVEVAKFSHPGSSRDRQFTFHFDGARGDCLADCVAGLAHISARVLSIHILDVQGDKAKVIGRLEAMTCMIKDL